jgi:hypothetical protein
MLNQWYPGFLEKDTLTQFQLQCQVFLELVSQMVQEVKKGENQPSPHPLLLHALRYGQTTLAPHDRPEAPASVRAHLRDVYSVVAYPDPTLSRVAHLLDMPTMRQKLVETVNAAILVFGGRPRSPPLLIVAKQAVVAGTQLALRHASGVPQSTLIHVAKDVLGGL